MPLKAVRVTNRGAMGDVATGATGGEMARAWATGPAVICRRVVPGGRADRNPAATGGKDLTVAAMPLGEIDPVGRRNPIL